MLQRAFHVSVCAKVCNTALIVPLCKMKCVFGEGTNMKSFYSNVDKEVLKILHRTVKSQETPRNRKWNVTLWEYSRILKSSGLFLLGWLFFS